MGPDVRVHLSLPAVLGVGLPQPGSLACKPYMRHTLSPKAQLAGEQFCIETGATLARSIF